MSQEKVKAVREAYERINANPQEPAAAGSSFIPTMSTTLEMSRRIWESFRDSKTVDEAMHEYWAMFDGFHIELIEVLQTDEELVVTAIEDGGHERERCQGVEPLFPRLLLP